MNKKGFVALLIGLLFSSIAMAQSEPKTLLGDMGKVGFYAGPSFRVTPMAGQTAAMFGGEAGVLLAGGKLSVGGAYYFSVNEFTPENEANDDLYLDARYGGLKLAYILRADQAVQIAFPLLVGIGEVETGFKDGVPGNENSNSPFGEDNMVVIEPGVQVQFQLIKNIRLVTGVSYRIANGVEYRGLDNSDISGLNGEVGLQIGIF